MLPPRPSRVELSREKISRDEERGGELSGFSAPAVPATPSDPTPTPESASDSFFELAASPSADTANADEKDELSELIAEGISESYINERRYRAKDYAVARKRRVSSVLREWWEQDRANYSEPKDSASSFDTDDFFRSALENSLKKMESRAENPDGYG